MQFSLMDFAEASQRSGKSTHLAEPWPLPDEQLAVFPLVICKVLGDALFDQRAPVVPCSDRGTTLMNALVNQDVAVDVRVPPSPHENRIVRCYVNSLGRARFGNMTN